MNTEETNKALEEISKEAVNDICEILSEIAVKGTFTAHQIRELVFISKYVNDGDIKDEG